MTTAEASKKAFVLKNAETYGVATSVPAGGHTVDSATPLVSQAYGGWAPPYAAAPYMPDRVLSFAEAQAATGLSKSSFYRHLRKTLPIVQLSQRRFGVRASDLAAFVASRVA